MYSGGTPTRFGNADTMGVTLISFTTGRLNTRGMRRRRACF